jgi:hypothetical protein
MYQKARFFMNPDSKALIQSGDTQSLVTQKPLKVNIYPMK